MTYKVLICRMLDGEIREHIPKVQSDLWGWQEEYMWTDGNYGCDCNRAIKFNEDFEVGCGENLYTIRVIEDGQEVYREAGFPEDTECPASRPTRPIAP